jgi:ATP-dependent exoDNAse (exonuclease V) alpha subunit
MYTAFTRARERLYLLNFVDAFFPGGGAETSD